MELKYAISLHHKLAELPMGLCYNERKRAMPALEETSGCAYIKCRLASDKYIKGEESVCVWLA